MRVAVARLRAWWARGGWVCLLALGLALTLKARYRHADVDALRWVLAPSCWLAARIGQFELVWREGSGFISHETRMVVGVACAGVNFMVVALLALFFATGVAWQGARARLGWLAASMGLAYVGTLASNALRIALAGRLYQLAIYGGLVTKARVHLLLGVVLYCAALLALCALGARIARGRAPWSGTGMRPARTLHARLAPIYWYAGVVLGIPLLGGAAQAGAGFWQYALLVLAVSAAFALFMQLAAALRDRLQSGVRCSGATRPAGPWVAPR